MMRRAVVCVVAIVVVALVATGCGCPMCKAVGKMLGAGGSKDVPANIAQKTCPVLGGPIDPSVHTDYQGTTVYFCCPGCIKKFEADPGKYMPKVKAQLGGS